MLLKEGKDILLGLWKVLLDLLSHMMTIAPIGGMVFFVVGGIIGFILQLRMRQRA